ncbi:MAG: PIG-L family deacetylase [Chloroflexi bacterium]|nr:PIG-L family deacetylase [Chloroflexota bacterium]
MAPKDCTERDFCLYLSRPGNPKQYARHKIASAVYLLELVSDKEPPMPPQPLRILHTCGHPADAFDNAGGTLALHAARGDQVTIAILSHGVYSHHIAARDRVKQGGAGISDYEAAILAKEEEIRQGCAILGITDVRFLRVEDDVVLANPELVRRLADVVRDVRPHLIVTHHPYENGGYGTHAETARMTLLAMEMARGLQPGETRPPAGGAQVYFVGFPGNTNNMEYARARFPDIIIDITPVVEKKVRAMDCLKSQYYSGRLGRKVIEAINGYYGIHQCIPYVEVFSHFEPEVYDALPTNEYRLRKSAETEEQWYARLSQFIAPFVPYEGQQIDWQKRT